MTAATTPNSRPWLQLHDGSQWFADAPHAHDYKVEVIAHALSQQCRFAGHSIYPYTVLHHSLLVGIEVARHTLDKAMIRAALSHDFAEAFVVDMPAPIKRMPEMGGYRRLIKAVERAIAAHFELTPYLEHQRIKLADLVLLATEHRDVLGPSPHDAEWLPLPPPREERIFEMDAASVRTGFLAMWKEMGGE